MKFKMKRLAATISAAVCACTGGTVLAQQAQQPKVEKIEVTGSNIKRVDAEGASAVQVITRADIDRTGASTVGDVVRNLPINSSGSFDDTFTGSFARGSSGVSLRGLGQRGTLTLINGRRMANFGFAQNLQDTFVDLNSIPIAAIERIEILKDGASAIYGSDALAGVVNVILRKDFQGTELSVGGGASSRSDGNETRASIAGGWGDLAKDRFNVLGVVDYFKRDTIWARDRELSATQDQRRFQGGSDLRSTVGNPGTFARRPGTNPFGNGNARQAFPSCPTDRILTVAGVTGTNCSEDTNVYQTLIPKTERLGLFSRATIEITPELSAFVEAGYNSTETFTQSPPFAVPSTQIGPSQTRQIAITLPVGHPNNPYAVPVDVRYRFSDVGPRKIFNDTDAKRVVVGAKGVFAGWDWESAYLYANSYSTQDDKNGIRVSGLLSVVADGSYNFLNPSANTQATYDRLKAEYQRRGDSTIKQFDLKGSTELFRLPGGSVVTAVGLEHRDESLSDNADDVLISGDVLGRGSSKAIGSRTLTSGFAEFSVPVLRSLELQLAVRHDKYSDFGGSTNPKVALRWAPTKELLVRGSFTRGFRAPNLVENTESAAFFFVNVRDTLRCAIDTVYCATTGVAGVFAGDPTLKPEKSESRALGFVWDITPSINVGVDAFDIKQRNIIASDSVQEIVNGENELRYAGRVVRAPASASDLALGAPGPILIVLNRYQNQTELRTKGVDLDLRWTIGKTSFGNWSLQSTNTYTHSYKTSLVAGGELEELAGTYGIPRYRSNSTLTWDYADFGVSATFNHVSKYQQSDSAPPGVPENVGAWDTLDLQTTYSGLKGLRLTFGVRNVLDRAPPPDLSSGSVPYDVTQHNPRGRYYYAGAVYRFR
jgi:iron complex outermembrane recepter protein